MSNISTSIINIDTIENNLSIIQEFISEHKHLQKYKNLCSFSENNLGITISLDLSSQSDKSEQHKIIEQLFIYQDKIFFYRIAEQSIIEIIHNVFKGSYKTLSFAESCTGGLISKSITDYSGCSSYFLGGIVSYSNEMKMKLLNVNSETLLTNGAVSKETALEMVIGCKKATNSDYAVSITGIAGPDGGTELKPVGLVYIALIDDNDTTIYRQNIFTGNRDEVRYKSMYCALNLLKSIVNVNGNIS